MQLTQKETDLLKDLKSQEQLCIDKYTKLSAAAMDPQLKTLFTKIKEHEQMHLDTITKIESGNTPQLDAGYSQPISFTATYGKEETKDKKNDSYLCADVLSTEKHVSNVYDTCIFEFKDDAIRQALNHIQTEEQGHGKMIYDYMEKNNMYC